MIDAAKVEQWAREAGLPEVGDVDFRRERGQTMPELEREAWDRVLAFAALAFAAGAEAMREAAAQGASDYLTQGRSPLGRGVATAIRALPLPKGIE